MEDAVEEAIVRAMRSPAVERAIAAGMDEGAVQRAVEAAVERALASDEVADAVIRALDTEVADRVWAEILASPKAQMLVERIAEAPEVRAAITEQGMGLVTDLGRHLTAVTERLDDALERTAHRLMRRPPVEEETTEVGLVTRIVAAAIDLGLLSAALSISSGLLASVIPFVFGNRDGLSVLGLPGVRHPGCPDRRLAAGRLLGAGGPDAGHAPAEHPPGARGHAGAGAPARAAAPGGAAGGRLHLRARRAGHPGLADPPGLARPVRRARRWSTTRPATRRPGRAWSPKNPHFAGTNTCSQKVLRAGT